MKSKQIKTGTVNVQIVPTEAFKNEPKSTEQAAGDILSSIRQMEPEDQNEVIKTVLKELAIDRHNSVRQYREAADRAGKNMDVFMYNAIGLEKIMAEVNERKG
jgi:hypothetical protein